MRTLRRLILLAIAAAAVGVTAAPAEATCNPGRFSVKPLVIEFPECHPPGGGPD